MWNGISKNKIDQPTLHASDPAFQGYSVTMSGPRQIVYYNHDCADRIVAWLKQLATVSFKDPTSDLVILSMGTKQQVYDMYQTDFDDEKCAKYFSQKENGQIILPTLNYFLNGKSGRKRKTLKFASGCLMQNVVHVWLL